MEMISQTKIKLSPAFIVHQNQERNAFLEHQQVNLSPCAHNWAKADRRPGRRSAALNLA